MIEISQYLMDHMTLTDYGDQIQDYSVKQLSDNTTLHEIKSATSHHLCERYHLALTKFDWFSSDTCTLEQVVANEAQLVVIYRVVSQLTATENAIGVGVLDFCDSVLEQKK